MNSKIKTWEWAGLIIGTLVIDIFQVILTLFAVGVIINRFIDIGVGFGLPIYFWIRGINMLDTKRLGAAILAGMLEEMGLGGDDGLPMWTFEVILIWATVKGEQKIANNPLMGKALNVTKQIQGTRSPINSNGVRQPNNQTTTSYAENTQDIATNKHITPPPLNSDGMRAPKRIDTNETLSA